MRGHGRQILGGQEHRHTHVNAGTPQAHAHMEARTFGACQDDKQLEKMCAASCLSLHAPAFSLGDHVLRAACPLRTAQPGPQGPREEGRQGEMGTARSARMPTASRLPRITCVRAGGRAPLSLQEVFISYGNECNDKLLLDYGFSLPGPTGPCEWGRRQPGSGGRDERGARA